MNLFKAINQVFIISILLVMCISCSDSDYTNDSEFSSQDNSERQNDKSNSGCNYADGTHSATVDYTNPETGYSNTYILDVEVENCEVTQINFPKGGWLDSDHISPAELDFDGACTIKGEEGKTYEIQIDK